MPDDSRSHRYTALAVAECMVQQIEQAGWLHQSHAVHEIRRQFGDQFLYENKNGHPAIDKQVIKLFNEHTKIDLVWVSRAFMWRRWRPTDKPGRSQSR
jgi:hypothetical protein